MSVAVATAFAHASGGVQTITTTDLHGDTPVAVLFIYGRASASEHVISGFGSSYGFSDGAAQGAAATFMASGRTNTPFGNDNAGVVSYQNSDCCLVSLTTGGVQSKASFAGFIPNGVKINWSQGDVKQGLITVLFFAGGTWGAKVGHFSVTGANETPVETSLGFQPDAVICLGTTTILSSSVSSTRARMSFGATTWPFGPRKAMAQVTWGWPYTDQYVIDVTSVGTGVSFLYYENFGRYSVSVNRTINGFTNQASVNAPIDGEVLYLALIHRGIGHLNCDSFSVASTTNQTVTNGFGGRPGGFVMLLHQALGFTFDQRSGAYLHTFSKSGGYYNSGLSDSANLGPSNVSVHYSTVSVDEIYTLNTGGTTDLRGTITDYAPNGLTFNFSDLPELASSPWLYFTIVDYEPPAFSDCIHCGSSDTLPIVYPEYNLNWINDMYIDVPFPYNISFNSVAATFFEDDVTTVDSGISQRQNRWTYPLMEFDVGWGVRSLEDLHSIISYFRTMKGRINSFPYWDPTDFTSTLATIFDTRTIPPISHNDQILGTGDGSTKNFQLKKRYPIGDGTNYGERLITKPMKANTQISCAGGVFFTCPGTKVSLNGVLQTTGYTIDFNLGLIGFTTAPAAGVIVRAGFWFFVPSSFNTKRLPINLEAYGMGSASDVKLIERRNSDTL